MATTVAKSKRSTSKPSDETTQSIWGATAEALQPASGHTALAKVLALGGEKPPDVVGSNALPPEILERMYTNAGAIEPPYSMDALARLYEHSNSLRQCVDAYATNIDGFGHSFDPIIDFDTPDADVKVADAIFQERTLAVELGAPPPTTGFYPTSDEIKATKQKLAAEMRAEHDRLEHFFTFAVNETSFVSMRRRMRADYEQLGNSYCEVLRNRAGEIAEFVYIPAFTIRICQMEAIPTQIKVRRKRTKFSYQWVERSAHFRRYVQIVEGRLVFFKEMGDPRIMSKKTGGLFKTVEDLTAADPSDRPATEILHLKIASSRSIYGIPRWIGNLLSVIGSRQAEEINQLYFDNKGVPPLAILVSGGRIAPAAVKRLESYIENDLKGRKNFHKILIVEAEGTGGAMESAGSVKLEMKPLKDAQQDDALFQEYDERNMDKVGMAFRLPRILRGDIRDFNRATAEASLDFAEQQVFGPEREEFDFIINRRVFADLGIRFWEFKSKAPSLRDPTALGEMIVKMAQGNILTPEEARELTEDVFNKELKNLNDPWVKQPVALTLAGIVAAGNAQMGPYTGQDAQVAETPDVENEVPAVTRTALGAVISVNEARAAHGLGPKLLPDGTQDPDGSQTIMEYTERLKAKILGAQGQAPPGGGTNGYTLQDLLRGDGIPTGQAQQKQLAKGSMTPLAAAQYILGLRADMVKAESMEARKAFLAAKGEELREDGVITPEFISQLYPMSALINSGIA